MRFSITTVRGDQLVDEINAATGLGLTNEAVVVYLEGAVEIVAPPEHYTAIAAVIAAHVPQAVWNDEDQARVNADDVCAHWNLVALKDKTPAEIYALMQGQMDTWTTLADARRDLREWLPLMAAAIAWGGTQMK
jgi:hypothetical protein